MLNRIEHPGVIWLASDIHLGPDTPKTREIFHAFLDQACAEADALILCGDIFDVWIGDDAALDDPPPWLVPSLEAFRRTAGTISLWLARGNRDFLIGPSLARHLGAKLLPQPVLLATPIGDVLVTHGDEYCTDDIGYQRFKRLVRNPFVQGVYLSLSLARRRRIAQYARQRSMASHGQKASAMMDVTPDAVRAAFEQSGASVMVHGHTHRPGMHKIETPSGEKRRYVLPDWECEQEPYRGGWVSIDREGVEIHTLDSLIGRGSLPHARQAID